MPPAPATVQVTSRRDEGSRGHGCSRSPLGCRSRPCRFHSLPAVGAFLVRPPGSRFMTRVLSTTQFLGSLALLLLPVGSPARAWESGLACIDPSFPSSPAVPDGIDEAAGQRAMREARRHVEEGRGGEALLHLEVARRAFPVLADRFALLRGQVLLGLNEPERACEAFDEAKRSVDGAVTIQADVGSVRCRIASGARTAEMDLRLLRNRYPRLPEWTRLRFELAEALERRGRIASAVAIYREIDRAQPGSSLAAASRVRIDSLREAGHSIPPLTTMERFERLERMLRWGPEDLAREEIRALSADVRVPRGLRARITSMAADLDEPQELEIAEIGESVESNEIVSERASAEARVRAMAGDRPYGTLPLLRLGHLLRVATALGARASVDQILDAMIEKKAAPTLLYHAALRAAGMGSDDRIAALLEPLLDHPEYGVVARYHRARALERLGRLSEAEAEYRRVEELDSTETRYYAMWSAQRLSAVRDRVLAGFSVSGAPIALVTHWVTPATEIAFEIESARDRAPDADVLVARIEPLVDELGDAFPWLARAAVLLRLREFDAAADELHEAFLAWREAIGRPLRRVGLESIYRGEARAKPLQHAAHARKRRELGDEAREELARIAEELGDVGVAIGFRGWRSADDRPRAYAHLVDRAARRHGLDPNLLLAVMRVESVYQKRIISHAGAIGLMQIMPGTGARLAHLMGRETFTTADLLDPETNLDLAAWYLASLIRRFEGRLPLAIASYNGGPLNVQRWLRDAPREMPLDVFLEHIPFRETHRYVRRVLSHYAAYRTQQGLPMERLNVELPVEVR